MNWKNIKKSQKIQLIINKRKKSTEIVKRLNKTEIYENLVLKIKLMFYNIRLYYI